MRLPCGRSWDRVPAGADTKKNLCGHRRPSEYVIFRWAVKRQRFHTLNAHTHTHTHTHTDENKLKGSAEVRNSNLMYRVRERREMKKGKDKLESKRENKKEYNLKKSKNRS